MRTTAKESVWDGRESRRMARVLGQSSLWSRRQQGTRAWGLRSGNEPIGRTKSPQAWRAARGWAGLPRTLTTGGSRAGERLQQRLEAPATSGAGWVARIVFVFHAIAVSFDNECLPVMHQPVDQGCGQGVVHIKEGAPFPEGSIRGQHDRSGFITGSDHLEQQVGPALVDRQIAQLIEEEKSRTDVRFDCFPQQAVGLRHNKMIDHVYHARIANRIATLTRRVTQCSQEMRLSRSGGPNQHGAAVLLDEIAVEQPQDRRFGDSLGEVELILGQGLLLGKACLTQSPLEGSLLPGGLFQADQGGQDLQHGGAVAGRLIQHLAVALRNLQKL